MRRDVLARHLGDQALLHAEERADAIERGHGLVDQLTVAEQQDVLPGEQSEKVLQLLAVPAETDVVPEGRPARGDAARLLRAGADDVADGFEPRRPQVRPVRMRALDRVTQDDDQLGVREQRVDAALGVAVVQVERCGLAFQRSRRRVVEQRLVLRPAPDVLLEGQRVAGTAPCRRGPVAEEELGLLDRGHEQGGVSCERGVQGGRPRLGRSDHQEIR